MKKNEKKSEKIIIKCKDCGFKYYDGDVHKCLAVNIEEKTKEPEEIKDSIPEIKDAKWFKRSKKT